MICEGAACVCVCVIFLQNDKMPQTNKRKCSRQGYGEITSVCVWECMNSYVSHRVGWLGKMIGFSGRKRQSRINKKCAINEMEYGGREAPGREI